MKKLLIFGVLIVFSLLGWCINTSEQKHGEMISEIIETFDPPDMTKETTKMYSKFINLSIDVSSVVKKYIAIGTDRSEVVKILKYQKIIKYAFYTYDYEYNKINKKIKDFVRLDIEKKFVSGFSQISFGLPVKSGKEHFFKPHNIELI